VAEILDLVFRCLVFDFPVDFGLHLPLKGQAVRF
jgi:hypothetical protein